jgi:hypothetical protein
VRLHPHRKGAPADKQIQQSAEERKTSSPVARTQSGLRCSFPESRSVGQRNESNPSLPPAYQIQIRIGQSKSALQFADLPGMQLSAAYHGLVDVLIMWLTLLCSRRIRSARGSIR